MYCAKVVPGSERNRVRYINNGFLPSYQSVDSEGKPMGKQLVAPGYVFSLQKGPKMAEVPGGEWKVIEALSETRPSVLVIGAGSRERIVGPLQAVQKYVVSRSSGSIQIKVNLLGENRRYRLPIRTMTEEEFEARMKRSAERKLAAERKSAAAAETAAAVPAERTEAVPAAPAERAEAVPAAAPAERTEAAPAAETLAAVPAARAEEPPMTLLDLLKDAPAATVPAARTEEYPMTLLDLLKDAPTAESDEVKTDIPAASTAPGKDPISKSIPGYSRERIYEMLARAEEIGVRAAAEEFSVSWQYLAKLRKRVTPENVPVKKARLEFTEKQTAAMLGRAEEIGVHAAAKEFSVPWQSLAYLRKREEQKIATTPLDSPERLAALRRENEVLRGKLAMLEEEHSRLKKQIKEIL